MNSGSFVGSTLPTDDGDGRGDRMLRRDMGQEWSHRWPGSGRMRLWCDWLARHGVDYEAVPLDAVLVRDLTGYRLHYQSFVVTKRSEGGITFKIDPVLGELVIEDRFVQLEGPPLPFPEP